MFPQCKVVLAKSFNKQEFEALQLNASKVIYNTVFIGCDFTNVEIDSLAFFKCLFIKCIFNLYPTKREESNYLYCEYSNQKSHDTDTIKRLSDKMYNKEIEG
jgi:hypothetical protein